MAKRRVAYFLFLIVALVLAALAVAKYLYWYWYSPQLQLTESQIIEIERGDTVPEIFRKLRSRQLLHNDMLTKLCIRLFERGFVIKAGEYVFLGELSRSELFRQLSTGLSRQYRVTIVEGQTAGEVYRALDELLSVAEQHRAEIQPLNALLSAQAIGLMPEGRTDTNPEGWFFPDTYFYTRGDSPAELLTRAHQRMLAVLLEEWDLRQPELPYRGPYQALIMASLIEKETGVVDEQGAIAGVFLRRLQRNMRLQTDPSVIYGMGSDYSGDLRRSDLKRDTPYNTYTRHGLPPTPIALPGRTAIRAALNPEAGEALYFVAKGDGRHHFSRTLDEHLKAVRKYQIENRRSDYRSSPVPRT